MIHIIIEVCKVYTEVKRKLMSSRGLGAKGLYSAIKVIYRWEQERELRVY